MTLDPDGRLVANTTPSLSDARATEALEWMLLSRAIDKRAFALQRQGRLGTFSPVRGQEASVVASAMALDPARDWIVPQYRELPAWMRHGYPLTSYFLYVRGHPKGNRIPDGVRMLPIQISIAAQIPHAVGLAWGLRRQGSDAVVIVYFGDGASSEGDFHEACNLAGVVRAPVIFMLQNNGWAISTPRTSQSAAVSLASRAEGYGISSATVDGNDLFAVHAAVDAAVGRARDGGGATLVESLTHRLGPHNTADDPSRYMDPDVVAAHEQLDPITRVRSYLQARGCWDDAREAAVGTDAESQIATALAEAEATAPPGGDEIYGHVYAQPHPRLVKQREAAWPS